VDYSWSVTGTALPFWSLLGLAVALTGGVSKPERGTERRSDGATGRPAEALAPEPSISALSRRVGAPSPRRPVALAVAGLLMLALNVAWLKAAQRQASGRIEMGAGDLRAAVEEYRAAPALTPLDAALQIDLASALGASGDVAGAEAALRRAARLAPTWGRPYHVLGRLLEREGQLKEAETAFEAASWRDPRNTQPLERLAAIREASGDHTGALAAWEQIVRMARDPNSRFYALDEMTDPIPGLAYEALGREDELQGRPIQATADYRAGAERLRQWRQQRPRRQQIRAAQGERPSEREADFQRAEIRLWQRLAALYTRAGQAATAAEAEREAAAAQAALQALK
jgi:tetratricopeptide (TPR) repeat protein